MEKELATSLLKNSRMQTDTALSGTGTPGSAADGPERDEFAAGGVCAELG